jgi:hypothetical protein
VAQHPARDELRRRLDVLVQRAIVVERRDDLAHRRDRRPHAQRRDERRALIDAHARGHDLDRERAPHVLDDLTELAGRHAAHRHVVLFSGRRRDAVDARRVREDLVLADERRARDLRDHEARVEAAVPREERREAARQRRVHQLLDATLGDVAELGGRHRGEIEREGQRLPVEVAATDQVRVAFFVEEHERVVGDAVDLAREHLAGPAEGVARRAVHLRHAAERIRVLHAATFDVARHERAVAKERAQVRRGGARSRVRTHADDARIERPHRSLVGLEADGAGDVGDRGEPSGLFHREHTERRHQLRAVDEREALLRGEHDGREPRHRQRIAAGDHAALVVRLALAREHQGEVRERREITRRAHAPLPRNARVDVLVEHRAEQVGEDVAHARVAQRDDLRAQQHHRAHLGDRQVRADAARVAADQVLLQLLDVGRADARLGKEAEPGVHAVDARGRVAAVGDAIDRSSRGAHLLARLGAQLRGPAAAGDVLEIGGGEGAAEQHRRGATEGRRVGDHGAARVSRGAARSSIDGEGRPSGSLEHAALLGVGQRSQRRPVAAQHERAGRVPV